MMLDLFDELAALVAALDDAGLDYALVGALALAVHGAPRATTDIDLLVRDETVELVLATASTLGYDLLIQMKLAAGRTRDLADVERLREQDR